MKRDLVMDYQLQPLQNQEYKEKEIMPKKHMLLTRYHAEITQKNKKLKKLSQQQQQQQQLFNSASSEIPPLLYYPDYSEGSKDIYDPNSPSPFHIADLKEEPLDEHLGSYLCPSNTDYLPPIGALKIESDPHSMYSPKQEQSEENPQYPGDSFHHLGYQQTPDQSLSASDPYSNYACSTQKYGTSPFQDSMAHEYTYYNGITSDYSEAGSPCNQYPSYSSRYDDLYMEDGPLDLTLPKEEGSYNEKSLGSHEDCSLEDSSDENGWLKKIKTGTRSRVRSPKSWEFLVRLLMDSRSNPSMIKWENIEAGTFRLVQKDEIAKIWGKRSHKHKDGGLSYDNFARNLRYHYKTRMLVPVSEKHLVYRFSEDVLKKYCNARMN